VGVNEYSPSHKIRLIFYTLIYHITCDNIPYMSYYSTSDLHTRQRELLNAALKMPVYIRRRGVVYCLHVVEHQEKIQPPPTIVYSEIAEIEESEIADL